VTTLPRCRPDPRAAALVDAHRAVATRRSRLSTWAPGALREIVIIALCYTLYGVVRNAKSGHPASAYTHAHDIQRAEGTLHLGWEHAVNGFFSDHRGLAVISGYYYATLHFILTLVVLGWVFVRRRAAYARLRTALAIICLVALACFYAWPLAPPRLVGGGYDDIIHSAHVWGSWGTGAVASAGDQYAAMPSLHTAWSLWVGVTLVLLARRRWVRVLAALYPLTTMVVILGTANHWVLDLLAGFVVLGVGFLLQPPVSAAAARVGAAARRVRLMRTPLPEHVGAQAAAASRPH